jgi:hypothetical protein
MSFAMDVLKDGGIKTEEEPKFQKIWVKGKKKRLKQMNFKNNQN